VDDDAKREAEAKRVTEGELRKKRKGKDFFSDEEGEEGEGKTRMSKKERKQRKLDFKDGLSRISR
jgi:mediator of replication checkpoint protein 1